MFNGWGAWETDCAEVAPTGEAAAKARDSPAAMVTVRICARVRAGNFNTESSDRLLRGGEYRGWGIQGGGRTGGAVAVVHRSLAGPLGGGCPGVLRL
jgi:hypothetical protein